MQRGGDATPEPGKEEAGKEELPPLTPPARCAAPGGVRKAPAPFRPASERFAATTVEEILAKMEQPRKEVPASPDRLWGSRLTFNHDGSSRYGLRTYGVAAGPKEEDSRSLARDCPQEGLAKTPAECQEAHSKTPEERSPTSAVAINGDLAKPASSEPAADVSKPWDPPSPGPASEPGGSASLDLSSPASAPGSPRLPPRNEGSPCHAPLPEAQSPAAPHASPCIPATPASPRAALPNEGPWRDPSPGLPTEHVPEAPASSSPPLESVSGCHGVEQPPPISPQPPVEGSELVDITRTLPCGEEVAARADPDPRPVSLAQRRFSEGVLRPSGGGQDQEKLGGSLAALPQGQGSQSALDRPFGSGTESNWSLSQSFEWTFPTRPSGLGVWRLDSPPPSPITEASEAAEAAEAGTWAISSREAEATQQGPGAGAAPGGSGRPSSWVQAEDPGISPPPKGDGESHPQSPAAPPEPLPPSRGSPDSPLLQAEERYEEREPVAGQECPLPLATREEALPMLEPVLGQQQSAPPDQPCVLFADVPDPGHALPAEEETLTLARAETTQPRTEAPDPCRVSPEPTGPEGGSRWLDDLLASPPPSAGSMRRGAGAEPKDAQSPSTCSEGLLGWAQKDLQSEFGIAADPHPTGFRTSSWSQDASQDYGLGSSSPGGNPGLGERDWSSKFGQGAGEGRAREWASRCSGISLEEMEVTSSQDGSEAQERAFGEPAQPSSQEADVQDWEFRRKDSQGTYSSRDAELQDQEFGKRDSLGAYSSRDASLQDWEFGKRDSLGPYASPEADEQEGGREGHLHSYSSQDTEEQDREFQKRDSLLGSYGSRAAAQQDQEFGQSAWLRDYSSGSSSRVLGTQDTGFAARTLSSGFSAEEAQQQDEEFEKKLPSGESSRDSGRPEERESGGLFGPSTPQLQDGGTQAQRDQSSWQGSDTNQEAGRLQGREQAGGQGPDAAALEDGEAGKRGWADEFSRGVAPQLEAAFSPGQQAWSRDFCAEAAERGHQFGIIGNDRVSAAGLSPSSKMGETHPGPSGKTTAGPMDWTDQLGLRNLDVSSCVGSEGSGEARESALGQMDWSDNLHLRDVDLAGSFETVGSAEPRGTGAGEKDWTSDVGVRSRDVAGVGELGGHGQARESGVGQTDWSGVEAGDFLKARERGVGQADWTPDLGLRNMVPGAGCSPGEPRELGVGQMDWGNSLGLRNLDVPCALESGSARGCGVGQIDWAQDLGLRNVELSGAPSETREHGVGEVGPGGPEPGLRSNGGLALDLEASDALETRELGVGETSGSETQWEDNTSPSLETHPEDPRMETGEAPSFGASPSGCLARSPPSGSQDLLEGMLATSSFKAGARRESTASGHKDLLEDEGAAASADQGEPLPAWRPQPDGEASRVEEVDGTWGPAAARQGEQGPALSPWRPPQGPPPSTPSQDFSFIEDTEVLDSAMYRSRANLGRKRGHRAPAIRPGGTLGLSEAAESDARLFQDSTEPRAARVPSSDEEVVEEPQSRRTRMSLGTKGLKVNLFPGLSPSALKAKLRPRNRSAEEGEPVESKSSQKESAVQRSKSCKVPGLGKPLALPPKPEKSSGSEGSSPNWLQALKLKKKKV